MNQQVDKLKVAANNAMLISANQLAEMLQISERTLWRLLSSGQILPPVRFGGNTRWRFSDVEQWIEQGCPAQGE